MTRRRGGVDWLGGLVDVLGGRGAGRVEEAFTDAVAEVGLRAMAHVGQRVAGSVAARLGAVVPAAPAAEPVNARRRAAVYAGPVEVSREGAPAGDSAEVIDAEVLDDASPPRRRAGARRGGGGSRRK